VGSFPANDLAVIHLEDATPRPATFADSSKIEVGEVALAIGNPLGLRSSVTEGIVSSVGRTVSAGEGVVLPSVIQTSAPINPGNSGGALVDLSGRVIGIPTLAALVPELGSAAPGIGFVVDQLIEYGRVLDSNRAFLRVRVSTTVGGQVVVSSVEQGGPAARAGIRPGDIIVARRRADPDLRRARCRARDDETGSARPGRDHPQGRAQGDADRDARRATRLATDADVESEQQQRPEDDRSDGSQHAAGRTERVEVVLSRGYDDADDDPRDREERGPEHRNRHLTCPRVPAAKPLFPA
jgi:Trypsin-like peptidase domain/PDZ domain